MCRTIMTFIAYIALHTHLLDTKEILTFFTLISRWAPVTFLYRNRRVSLYMLATFAYKVLAGLSHLVLPLFSIFRIFIFANGLSSC